MCVYVCLCVFLLVFQYMCRQKLSVLIFILRDAAPTAAPRVGQKNCMAHDRVVLSSSLADPLLANECSKSSLLGVELSQPDGCLAVWVAAWLIVKVISDLIFQMVAHTKCRRSRLRKGRGHAPIVGYCIRQCRQFVKASTVFLTFFLFYDLFLFFASIRVSFLHSCIVSSFSSSCRVFCAF